MIAEQKSGAMMGRKIRSAHYANFYTCVLPTCAYLSLHSFCAVMLLLLIPLERGDSSYLYS
jgi:hypothetical protein